MYNFEQIGFIPRSIIRTLKRFFKQISLKTDLFVIYEFRVSRYIAIASLQCFFFLIICPWTFQFFVKFIFLNTFLKYKTIPTDIFINIHQQERAFSQIQTFSQKIYFETLLESLDLVRGPVRLGVQPSAGPSDPDPTSLGVKEVHASPSTPDAAPYSLVRFADPKPPLFKVPRPSHRSIFEKRLLNSENGMGWSAPAPKVRQSAMRTQRRARADHPEQHPTPRMSNEPSEKELLASLRDANLWRSRFGSPLGPAFGGTVAEKPVSLGLVQSSAGPQLTQKIYQSYFLKCAHFYNQQSLSIITNWIIDLVTLLFFFVLLILLTPQILILKTFCIESLLSLSETTKCFFLIFFLDLLVGFHSSKSWEIFLQFFIEHFGFQIHPNFIAFFISTFPVLLDTIFKYWIFRYLNKISPSTVATYQAMIE